jgi:hypothetical protein
MVSPHSEVYFSVDSVHESTPTMQAHEPTHTTPHTTPHTMKSTEVQTLGVMAAVYTLHMR